MKQYVALDDTVYFWFAANDTSGSGGDGATPATDIRLAGAAADAAPVYSPTPVLLSHVNYPAGAYEIAIVASAGNGFAANNTYAIFCTLAIDSQNPTGFVGSFDLKPVEATLADKADFALSTAARAAITDDVWDEELTGAIHNIATSAGRRLRQAADVMIIREETCQAGGGNDEIIFDAGASAVNEFYINDFVVLISGTGVGQQRHIDSYVGSSKTATVNRNWTPKPDATTGFVIKADSTKHVHGFETEAKAEIESEVNDALVALKLDHLVAVADDDDPVNNSIIAMLVATDGDWSNFAKATDALQSIRDVVALASVCTEARLAHLDADVSSVGGIGSGALSCTWTQKDDDENPMDNVQVWLTTDDAGANVIAGTLLSNSSGEVTFMLDAGTYYVWREKAGYNFTNPQTWSVS